MKELLFSLSKNNGDFVVEYFNGEGKGGQNRNKREMACRIHHPKSGALAACQEERSQEANRKLAFKRLCNTEKFKAWLECEIRRHQGVYRDIEEKIEKTINNIRVECQVDGKWVEVDDINNEELVVKETKPTNSSVQSN